MSDEDDTPRSLAERLSLRNARALIGRAGPPLMAGRFELRRELGGGGMGDVFTAWDPELEREVAIKVLKVLSSDAIKRFRRESRALARLSHPNIVHVYEAGPFEDGMFIAMELVEGRTLERWVQDEETQRRRSWVDVLRVYRDAGKGLAAAHAAGMVHRDFKPANVMVGADGHVRVLDFGIACSVDAPTNDDRETVRVERDEPSGRGGGSSLERYTVTGVAYGTPPFMAPEQSRGTATPASDQFSFCVSLYESLLGLRPFVGNTPYALYDAKIEGRIEVPDEAPNVPKKVLAAVRRGLEADPSKRWPSMEALLDELAAAESRPKRLRLLGMGALVGVGVVGLASVVMLERTPEAESPCAALEDRRDGVLPKVWDPERKAALHRAFVDSGAASAERSWSVVEASGDAWAQALGQAQHEACMAHRVRGEQSAEAMDLRMACLGRQHDQLRALGEGLLDADADAVERAPMAMVQLPSPSACDDVERLRGELLPPEALADEVERVRETIEDARAMHRLGRFEDGLTLAREAVEQAEPLRYRPLASEARAVLGLMELQTDARDEGIANLERAARDATRDGHDTLGAWAWLTLARFAAQRLQMLEPGRRWWRDADVLYERAGLRDEEETALELLASDANLDRLANALPEAQSKLGRVVEARRRGTEGPEAPTRTLRLAAALDDLANVVLLRGRADEAVALHTEGLKLHAAVLGTRHPITARSEYNLATALRDAGRPEEALEHYERALSVLGPRRSREAGRTHGALAGLHFDQGRLAEATEHARQAREIYDAVLPADHPEQARAWDTLGVLLFSRGELEESVVAYERALQIYERTLGTDHAELALTVSNLGESLLALARFEQALEYFERADRMLVRDKGEDDPDRLYVLKGTGLALLGLGRVEPATEALRRAWALSSPTVAIERGEIAMGLAIALADEDRAEARRFAAQARSLLSGEAGAQRMKMLIETLGDAARPFEGL